MARHHKYAAKSEIRPKATQWSFTLPHFTSADIVRFSNLPAEDVLYITFATCNDDTGNSHLQGFVKTTRRCRVNTLIRLLGYASFNIISTPTSVKDTLMEIQMNPSFIESGDASTCNRSGYRSDLASFKADVKAGFSTDQLKTKHPKFFDNYESLVHNYIYARQAKRESETYPLSNEELLEWSSKKSVKARQNSNGFQIQIN
jgi:hypothetical protein